MAREYFQKIAVLRHVGMVGGSKFEICDLLNASWGKHRATKGPPGGSSELAIALGDTPESRLLVPSTGEGPVRPSLKSKLRGA